MQAHSCRSPLRARAFEGWSASCWLEETGPMIDGAVSGRARKAAAAAAAAYSCSPRCRPDATDSRRL
eukprot:7059596-Prymnesium_polylepis.1